MNKPVVTAFCCALLSLPVVAGTPAAPAVAPGASFGAAEAEAFDRRLREFIAPNVALPREAKLEIEVGTLDPRLRLAPCQRIEPQLPPASALWGRTRIGLKCVQGEKNWSVWLPVTVKVLAPALVPMRALAAGTVLEASHLHGAVVDWAAQPGLPLTAPQALLGRTLMRAAAPGQALRAADLRQRQFFAAGDVVQVLARGDGFAVGSEAQAIGPGIEGQPVRVRTEAGRILTGLPVGDRRVEVVL